MRILLATPDFPPRKGGIQLLCERLAQHSRFRYEVVTLASGKADDRAAGVVSRIPHLGNHRADVVALNALTVKRGLSCRPDAIVSGHIVAGPGALAVQRLIGSPVVQYLYSKELVARPALARLVTRRATASIAISSSTRSQAIVLGAPADRVQVIPPGVDAPPVSRTVRRQERARTIITVARLEDHHKGFDVMVQALPLIKRRVPDVRWVVVGDGPLRNEIQAAAHAASVGNLIQLTGAVDDQGRDRWLDQADVFAMPSRPLPGGLGGEGFGIAYLEAGAHGLPCVAGNHGGSADAVIDGETGITVDPTDPVAVADAIAHLLLDPGLSKRLGERGRARAATLSWAWVAEQVDQLVEEVVTSRCANS